MIVENAHSQITTSTVSLSNLKAPDIKRVNPHAAEAERTANQLCFDLGIGLSHIDNYATQAGYLFPETGPRRLVTMILFFNFLYYIDDVYDRHQDGSQEDRAGLNEVFLSAAQIFVSGQKSKVRDNPILRAAYEQHLQFTSQAPHLWVDRFAAATMAHLKGTLFGLEDNRQPGKSLLDRYNRLRDFDCGMEPTLDLIEFAQGMVMESRLLSHPVVQAARHQVARYCGLSNDLFSFEKEVVQYGSDFNIVPVMMQEGVSFSAVVERVIMMLNEMVDTFKVLEAQQPLFDDPLDNQMVAQYFRGLRHEISAAYHWQFSTTRYRSPESPFIELREPLPV